MRRALPLIALAAVTLVACPTPPEQSSTPGGDAPPPQGGPQAGAGGPGGGNAAGAPPAGGGGQAGAPPAGGAGGGGGPAGGPPSFKDLITGDTITVTVSIKGGTKGQIDFMTLGDSPSALHVEPFEGAGPFKIEAPASYDGEVYVAAMNYANGTSIGVGDPYGALPSPVEFKGEDLTVSLDIGQKADWFVEPDGSAPPPGGAPPAGGGGGQAGSGQGGAGGGPAGAGGPPPDGAGGPPPDGAGGPPPDGAGGPPPDGAGGPPPGGDAGAPPPGGDAGAPPPQ